MNRADGVRVGDHDRATEGARFVDPVRAGHLTIAIKGMDSGGHRFRDAVAAKRQDRRDARPNCLVLGTVVVIKGHHADGEAGNISDRIEWPGCAGQTDS